MSRTGTGTVNVGSAIKIYKGLHHNYLVRHILFSLEESSIENSNDTDIRKMQMHLSWGFGPNVNTKLTLETTTNHPTPKIFKMVLDIAGGQNLECRLHNIGQVTKPQSFNPPWWSTPPPLQFLDLSAFFSLCNGNISQTQSLPKLNT